MRRSFKTNKKRDSGRLFVLQKVDTHKYMGEKYFRFKEFVE